MSASENDHRTTVPNDNTTLSEVLAAYEESGFTGSFSAVEGSAIDCHSCGEVSPAQGFDMTSMRRLEGASDPDDMSAVAAITCPRCGQEGTLILGFGPAAPPEDGDVLRGLQDRRTEGALPSNSAPGEAVGDES